MSDPIPMQNETWDYDEAQDMGDVVDERDASAIEIERVVWAGPICLSSGVHALALCPSLSLHLHANSGLPSPSCIHIFNIYMDGISLVEWW